MSAGDGAAIGAALFDRLRRERDEKRAAERAESRPMPEETFLQKALRQKAEREAAARPVPAASTGVPVAAADPRAAAWLQAKIAAKVAEVGGAAEGTRNHALNAAAYDLGHYVPAHLDREDVERALYAAAMACGLESRESIGTIRSGLSSGMSDPREVVLEDRATVAPPAPRGVDPATGEVSEPLVARKLTITRASSIKVRPVHWLWAERLPLGSLALLAGREGIGKSTVAYQLAADLTRGRLAGRHFGTAKSVVVAATEDSWEHTIVPRLMAADADLHRILRVDVATSEGTTSALTLPRDNRALGELVEAEDVALVLLDPLMSRLDSRLDSHKDAEVRIALEPITAMADRFGCSVLGIIHVNKGRGADALDRIMGSKAFPAVARAVLFVQKDPDDDALRLLGSPKNNLGRTDTLPTLAFGIESALVAETDEGPVTSGRIVWRGEDQRSIDEVLESSEDSGDVRSATSEAADWLVDWLTTQGGEAASKDAKAAGARAGHTVDALKRARRQAKVQTRSHGFPRETIWALAGAVGATAGESAPTALTAPTAPTGPQLGQSGQSVASPGERPTDSADPRWSA